MLCCFASAKRREWDSDLRPSDSTLLSDQLTLHSQVMLAAYHGHAPLVSLLVQHGADVNRLNDRGQSPLAGAVFKNEREVIEALLKGGADPLVGEPSAMDATKVFKQEEFEGMFKEQVERLNASGDVATNGH